jgi:GT2 family glycosyltransferase
MRFEIFVIGNQEKDFLKKRQKAMKKSKADLVMILNTDIKVSNYKKSLHLFNNSNLFAVTFSPKSSNTKKIKEVQNANGGSSIYNRKIWNEIGGIDLMYEPYWFDDTDYSRRALQRGYKILEDGNIKVRQTSTPGTELIKKSLKGFTIFWRNYFMYLRKFNESTPKRYLITPFFWPIIIWANIRYRKYHEV